MKRLILLAAAVVACGPSEQATTDTGQSAAAAAPAGLTAADLTGTFHGVSMPEGSDSVLARWTVVSTGMESKGVMEGSTDTLRYTHTFDADSFVAISAPYADPMTKGKPQVISRVVGRKMGDKFVGTEVTTLASKPDSVVMRTRWEATKAP